MDGSLKSLRGNVSTKNIKQIIKKIAQSLLCLKKKKLSYTDLKADNVLFKCYKKSEIDVKLGDLGSIRKKVKQIQLHGLLMNLEKIFIIQM